MTRNRTYQILHGIAPSVLPENEEKMILQYFVPKGKRGVTEQMANEIVYFFYGILLTLPDAAREIHEKYLGPKT